jgi:GNAT superfamily N-acetyltransferase
MKWDVRAATWDEIPSIRCLYHIGQKAFETAPDVFKTGSVEDVLREIPDGRVLVAVTKDGQVGGFARTRLAGDQLFGLNVAVAPAFQGNGVGRLLVLAGHDKARTDGAKRSSFVVWPPSGVQPFYEGLGYREVGRLMVKEL